MMTDWYRKVLADFAAGRDPGSDYTPDQKAAYAELSREFEAELKANPKAVFTIPQDTEGLPG